MRNKCKSNIAGLCEAVCALCFNALFGNDVVQHYHRKMIKFSAPKYSATKRKSIQFQIHKKRNRMKTSRVTPHTEYNNL